jgi:hypothetical protein
VVTPSYPHGRLYAAGGFHCTDGPAHTQSLSSVESFDVATNTWHLEADAMPGEPKALMVAVSVDNTTFLCVGGFNGTSGGDMSPRDLLRPIYQMRVSSASGIDRGGTAATASSTSWSTMTYIHPPPQHTQLSCNLLCCHYLAHEC